MAKKNNKKGVIGIYISTEQIAIAEVSLKGTGKMQPDHFVKFSTDFPKKGGAQRPMSLNADFFKNEAAWVSKFKSAVGKIGWGASEAVITLSESFSILRYFSMPAVPRKFWSKSIPLESKKYIPISFDNAALDYDAFLSDGGKKISVLFGITQKETVDFLTKLMKDVHFNLHSVEISAVSMERLFTYVDHKDHLRHGYVYAADDATHLLFSTGYRPVLHREFDNDGGLSERRRLDLKGAIQYVDRYSDGEGFKAIVLSGEYAQMMKDPVSKEAAPLPVTVLDLESLCGTNDLSSASIFAMGAALFGKVSSALRLDVSGVSNAVRVKSEIQKIVYTIGTIAIAILMLFTLKGEFQLSRVKKELNTYIVQNGESDLKNLSSDEINNKITTIKDQSVSLAYVFSRNDFVAPKLSVIVDEIPKQLWLENITYANGLVLNAANAAGVSGNSTRMMSLSGGTYLTGEARAQYTEEFLKKLKGYENEFKPFLRPDGNMTLSVSAQSKNKLLQSSGPNDGISKFSIDCLEGAK